MSSALDPLTKKTRLAAMDLLARREHSFAELVQKLTLRFPEELVIAQLSRLRDEKLQSDGRFTESYIYSRRQKGFGPVRIRSELYQRGVSSELISDYLFDDDDLWGEIVAELKRRKFGDSIPDDAKTRSKQYRFLRQRGFTSSQISAIYTP